MIGPTVGPYRVIGPISQGGMGSIYLAIDERRGCEVALKVLEADVENGAARFRAEADALARLNHPGIADFYEFFEHDGRPVMAMELVRGRTLQEIVDQVGPLPLQRAADICIEVLSALAYAHAAGIIHRDVKPANLMMTAAGTVKIMDFGIAQADGSVHLTQAGFAMGSPAYMSPEQIEGRAVDARADLYAVGIVFHRLLSGALPFTGATPMAMAQAHLNEAPVPLAHVRPDLPPWVGEIVARALAKSPEQRWPSATEFRDAISHGLAPSMSSAAPIDGPTEALLRPDVSKATIVPRRASATGSYANVVTWVGVAGAVLVVGTLAWFAVSAARTPIPIVAPAPAPPPTVAVVAPVETPAAPPVVPAKPAPAPAPKAVTAGNRPPKPARQSPVPTPVVSAPIAPARFEAVKLVTVIDTRTDTADVVLTLSDSELVALSRSTSNPLATVVYGGIAHATYVYARDPQWSPQASAPAQKINAVGVLGRKRHWLVVQTKDAYAILQLDETNWAEVLQAFESRSGVTVRRPGLVVGGL